MPFGAASLLTATAGLRRASFTVGMAAGGLGKAADSARSRQPVTKDSLSWMHFCNPTATKNLKLAALSQLNRALPNEWQKRSPRCTAHDSRNITRTH